jgi:hypothetical protein
MEVSVYIKGLEKEAAEIGVALIREKVKQYGVSVKLVSGKISFVGEKANIEKAVKAIGGNIR